MQIKYETTTDRPTQCKPSTVTKLDTYPLEAFTVQDVPPVTLSRDTTRRTNGTTPTLVQVILSPFFICHACSKIKTSQATLDENGTPNISLRETNLKAPFNLASQESTQTKEHQTDSNKQPDLSEDSINPTSPPTITQNNNQNPEQPKQLNQNQANYTSLTTTPESQNQSTTNHTHDMDTTPAQTPEQTNQNNEYLNNNKLFPKTQMHPETPYYMPNQYDDYYSTPYYHQPPQITNYDNYTNENFYFTHQANYWNQQVHSRPQLGPKIVGQKKKQKKHTKTKKNKKKRISTRKPLSNNF